MTLMSEMTTIVQSNTELLKENFPTIISVRIFHLEIFFDK